MIKKKPLTTMQKLNRIHKMSVVYDICFRNAGVAIQFYEVDRAFPKGDPGPPKFPRVGAPQSERDEYRVKQNFYRQAWQKGLIVYRYYPTFAKCISAEYKRLKSNAK